MPHQRKKTDDGYSTAPAKSPALTAWDARRIRQLLLMNVMLKTRSRGPSGYRIWVDGRPGIYCDASGVLEAYRAMFALLERMGIYFQP